jgi:hypothetical protein
MMRFIRRLMQPLPPRPVHTDEQDLLAQRRELDARLDALAHQHRQRHAIFLLEQEVQAVTAGRFRQKTNGGVP